MTKDQSPNLKQSPITHPPPKIRRPMTPLMVERRLPRRPAAAIGATEIPRLAPSATLLSVGRT